ncbi:hypothetical protein RJ639_036304 [Escallonia herrerae]|uniref:Reverse transcriptase Ty1/copia-type domain-containing protein n=1 Tax=Escallonia herrerae TaxID=1293975 RepID=A0AA88X486_9ASTE|nr:hypothetical protein RJ639_036304 [Escallonia herrerae]
MWHLRLGHLPVNRISLIPEFCFNLIKPRDKFAPRAKPGIFVGYPNGQKGYRIYDLESKRIYVFRDVQFLEGIYPYTKSSLGESRQVSNEEPTAGNIPLSTDLCIDTVKEPVMESIATEPISLDITVGCSESDELDPTVENQQAATLPSKRQRQVSRFLSGYQHVLPPSLALVENNTPPSSPTANLTASRNWYKKFTAALLAIGFRQSTADYSLFTFNHGGYFVVVLVYVDDVIITGTNSDRICKLKNYLDTKFHIKNLGKLNYFLGIEVVRSPAGIFLSQRKYVLDILAECGLTGYISYVVHILSQFMHDPRQPHLDAAYRVLHYLKGSPGQGILLPSNNTLYLQAFCDADWAGCPMTRKSTTGYIIFLGSSPVSWRAKKQTVVSRSSAEAEYRAMATITSEIIWLKQLLQDLEVSCITPVSLFCDNRVAIHIAANPVFHERTKHIEIDCHFIRQHIQSQTIATKSISSQDQLADIFTKALGHDRFHQLLGKLGISTLHAPT